jgi:hypothetical protein
MPHRKRLNKRTRENREYRRKLRTEGRCISCSRPRNDSPSTYRCRACMSEQAVRCAKKRNDYIRDGKCPECGNAKLLHSLLCIDCYFEDVAKKRTGSRRNGPSLKMLFEQQNGMCAYTQEPLILGLNASLDHVEPESKTGRLEFRLNDYEWVTRRVNLMKGSLSKDEFLSLVETIYKKASKARRGGGAQ